MLKRILILLLICSATWGQDRARTQIIYKYKKYQKIDLGNLSVKGKIITPGDISVKEQKRKKFSKGLYKRSNFDREMKQEIWDIR